MRNLLLSYLTRFLLISCVLCFPLNGSSQQAEEAWRHLSSKTGDLPVPGTSTQQTGCVVGDLAKDGVKGFVLSFRQAAPALVWYRHTKRGWDRYVIENEFLTVEAGGVVYDVDGDGWPDVLFGGDWQSNQVWWWRNPGPGWKPDVPWKRYTIKKSGATQQHDQIIGDFKGTGKPQLVYWNQGAQKLFIADIPPHPRDVEEWPTTEVFSGSAGENPGKYAEGLAACDIDGDGQVDLLAGNYWFKYLGNNRFKPIQVADIGGRIAAGHLLKGSKVAQVVIAPGDGIGPLKWYECKGDPADPKAWIGHDLLGRDMIHGHSLQIADVDGDGHLDIFAAEMAKWTESRSEPDNPNAQALIFYGDGKGNFRKTVFATGMGFHEARIADLNGDGRMDILDKPYNWDAPRVDVWLQLPKAKRNPPRREPAWGLELYSLRHELPLGVPYLLTQTQQMGFRDVELPEMYGMSAEALRQRLDQAGLTCSSIVFPYDRYGSNLNAIVHDARTLSAKYVVIGWIPHDGAFTAEVANRAIGNFNAWGKALAGQGLQLAYHPHGYEFQPAEKGTLFDHLVRETDPRFVNFEMDVFWIVHPGQDPVALMRKYPTRFPLMHLKDLRKGEPTGILTGSASEVSSVILGQGQLDFPAILQEARRIGVKRYYLEDEAPNAAAQLPQSLTYLGLLSRPRH